MSGDQRASYTGVLYKNASPIAFTDQSVQEHRSVNNVFQIDTPARQVLDYYTAITISESNVVVFRQINGVKSSSNTVDYDINFLFGILTRVTSGNPNASDIKVAGSYIPRVEIGGVQNWDFDWITNTTETTAFDSSDGGIERIPLLDDITLNLNRFYLDPSSGVGAESFIKYANSDEEVFFEGRLLGTGTSREFVIYGASQPVSIFRGFFLVTGINYNGDVQSAEMEAVSLEGSGGLGTGYDWVNE